MPFSLPTAELERLAAAMERFEATESVAQIGTGTRREGGQFEMLALEWWDALADYLTAIGADDVLFRASPPSVVGDAGQRFSSANVYHALTFEKRVLYVPAKPRLILPAEVVVDRDRWFDIRFSVSELIEAFPGSSEAVRRYAPESGPYAEQNYPLIYANMTTIFDGTVILEESGVLREKLLLEYKTAKSSRGAVIDGNAHERLSFQIMQYLEVATRYTKCSLIVKGNGAFERYRNKYHPNFLVQADRLSNFSWFDMGYCCSASEYSDLARKLIEWLIHGQAVGGWRR